MTMTRATNHASALLIFVQSLLNVTVRSSSEKYFSIVGSHTTAVSSNIADRSSQGSVNDRCSSRKITRVHNYCLVPIQISEPAVAITLLYLDISRKFHHFDWELHQYSLRIVDHHPLPESCMRSLGMGL